MNSKKHTGQDNEKIIKNLNSSVNMKTTKRHKKNNSNQFILKDYLNKGQYAGSNPMANHKNRNRPFSELYMCTTPVRVAGGYKYNRISSNMRTS